MCVYAATRIVMILMLIAAAFFLRIAAVDESRLRCFPPARRRAYCMFSQPARPWLFFDA